MTLEWQICTHLVNGKNILNYNPQFVIQIKDLSSYKSKYIFEFLCEHFHPFNDFSVCWKWEPNSVAIWDNRSVAYRVIPGGYDPQTREATRTAIFGEVPYYAEKSANQSDQEDEAEKEEIFDGYFGRYDEGKEGEITEQADPAVGVIKVNPSIAPISVN